MTVETWARGKKSQFAIRIADLDASEDIEKLPIDVAVTDCDEGTHGTTITLTSLHQHLTFPNPDKFRQLLLQEYGREYDFRIVVNGKDLGVDDVQGTFTSYERDLPVAGKVKLDFVVASANGKLKQPGISIRVDGKIVGKPTFFGLDNAEDFPPKLLNKIFGEIEVNGLRDHVTGDWGALVENSEIYEEVRSHIEPILRDKVREEYGRDIALAQARLQRKVNERLAALPEYKRKFADRAIKSILGRYYGEPESKVEPVVSVLLDALERTEYRAILELIHSAERSDIAKVAEVLAEFGLVELAIMGEQAKTRLEFLDHFEKLCSDASTEEALVHSSIENCLWILGPQYSVFSSNKTLKRQIEEYLGKSYSGKKHNNRPDLLLNVNHDAEYLLIEFKRPKHVLSYSDYQQATSYRNELRQYTGDKTITIILMGGKRGADLPPQQHIEKGVEVRLFSELLSMSRNQLNWLLTQLGGENHA